MECIIWNLYPTLPRHLVLRHSLYDTFVGPSKMNTTHGKTKHHQSSQTQQSLSRADAVDEKRYKPSITFTLFLATAVQCVQYPLLINAIPAFLSTCLPACGFQRPFCMLTLFRHWTINCVDVFICN